MSKNKRKRTNPYKQAEHAAYMEALRNGIRPPRATTFTDRKKKADREACRRFRFDAA